jgi:hypothetical protein
MLITVTGGASGLFGCQALTPHRGEVDSYCTLDLDTHLSSSSKVDVGRCQLGERVLRFGIDLFNFPNEYKLLTRGIHRDHERDSDRQSDREVA